MNRVNRVLRRRTLLRGAGGVAIALPLLETMRPAPAAAQGLAAGLDGKPKRILFLRPEQGAKNAIFWPTGTRPHPAGGVTDLVLSPILKPLERHRNDLLVIKGLDNKTAFGSPGNAHCNARTGAMTCSTTVVVDQRSGDTHATNMSFDQFLAGRMSAGAKFKSLEMGGNHYLGAANGPPQTAWYGPRQPAPFEANAGTLFDRLFRDFAGAGGAPPDNSALLRLRDDRKSVLDVVKENFGVLRRRLGSADRARLDAHFAKIRDLETQLDLPLAAPAASCGKPARPTLGFPVAGGKYNPGENLTVPWLKAMRELITLAFSCDLTRVISFVFVMDSYPFNPINHAGSFHDEGAHAQNTVYLQAVKTWLFDQLAALVDDLKAVKEGATGTSLFDNTAIVFFDEFMNGGSHTHENLPVAIVGSAGGSLRTGGRMLEFPNRGSTGGDPDARSMSQLWVGLQNALGIAGDTFGDPRFGRGALPSLT
jgi:hypothetical protein